MSRFKDRLFIVVILLLAFQWIVIHHLGPSLHEPWNAIAPGIAIFAAAFILSWAAELMQFEIPQSLAIAVVALVAVLPEYAVDMYFAWHAGRNPEYIHYATANMTGANRLLIGVGWAAVAFTAFFRSRKREIVLEKGQRIELFVLLLATLYCFVVPLKHSLSWVDSVVLFSIFFWYIFQAMRSHHEAPEIEGPVAHIANWPRLPRLLTTLCLFSFSAYTIFVAAEPFAEGLLSTGRHFGIEEFLLVQWLAPIASEAPEFIIAIIFAWRGKASISLGTLVSSKVNQWTLLVGMLPLVYNLSSGSLAPMIMDARQSEEILLTVAQSLFAIVVIANLHFSLLEAVMLFVLFFTQMFFTSTEARTLYAGGYILLALAWMLTVRSNRQGFKHILRDGLKHPQRI